MAEAKRKRPYFHEYKEIKDEIVEISEQRFENILTTRLNENRTELEKKIDSQRTEMKTEINSFRTETKTEINSLRTEMRWMIDLLFILMSIIMTVLNLLHSIFASCTIYNYINSLSELRQTLQTIR